MARSTNQGTAKERLDQILQENPDLFCNPRIRNHLSNVSYLPGPIPNRPNRKLFDIEPIDEDLGIYIGYCWFLGTPLGLFVRR